MSVWVIITILRLLSSGVGEEMWEMLVKFI